MKDSSLLRLQRAMKLLREAKLDMHNGYLNDSILGSYCSALQVVYAVCELSELADTQAQSPLVSFNKNYIETGIITKDVATDLSSLEEIVNASVVTVTDDVAEGAYNKAINVVRQCALFCGGLGVNLKIAGLAYYVPIINIDKFISSLSTEELNSKSIEDLATIYYVKAKSFKYK